MRAARRGQRMKMSDTRCIHKDGHAVWLSWLGDLVGPGQAILLRRSRHDREPASPGNIARERAIGARHHQYRARRLRPGRSAQFHPRTGTRRPRSMFGWSREEALGKNSFELIGPKDGPGPLQAALQRFLRSGQDQMLGSPAARSRLRRRDGKEFTAELSVTALKTPRRLPVQRLHPRPHRQDRRRGTDPASREDGSRRPAHRRHRA